MIEPLGTPTDLRAYQDADPILLVEAAQGAVRDYCGWHVAPSFTETLTVDGSGGVVQSLPTLHLTDVTEVTEDDVVLSLTDIEWSQAGFLRKTSGGTWTRKLRGVAVELTHGHPNIPAAVSAVVLSIAARAADSAPVGAVTRIQVGAVSRQYATGPDGQTVGVALSELEKAILDRYKLPARA